MRSLTVAQAKAHLSQLLQAVEAGARHGRRRARSNRPGTAWESRGV